MTRPLVIANVGALEAKKLFEWLALMTVGACAWEVGCELGLFDSLNQFLRSHGLTHLVLLTACIGLGAIAAIVRTSAELRAAIRARHEAELRAEQIARQDALTGLSNRRYFNQQLTAKLASRAPRETFAVMLIDLDRFKPVNDVHGHAAGDAVLCAVAQRLVEIVPAGGLVARLGGDEFVALIPDVADEAAGGGLASQMIDAVRRPIPWRQGFVEVDATIGVALAKPDTLDPDALLHAADLAMYQGKRQGRGVWRFYREEMDRALRARAELEADLRAAIAIGAIQPNYQPIVSLPKREVVGFEALARWEHPRLGAIEPQKFIPIAEETGLISELFLRLLRMACLDAREWPGHLFIAVNVSSRQLQDPRTPEKILAVLTQTRFPASRLEVEITELALINDLDAVRAALTSLQNLGVQVSLDDFGAGYSSLAHLSQLRFNKLKIDRSYLSTLKPGSERAKLVDAILQLGSSLSVETIAEGVESDENVEWLSRQGCSYGQGYLFGRAMPKREVEAYLINSRLIEESTNRAQRLRLAGGTHAIYGPTRPYMRA